MKYLVIGASGFLGCTIYDKLKKQGHQVVGTYCNNQKDDELIHLDLLDLYNLIEIYERTNPDVIIWTVLNHTYGEIIAQNTLSPFIRKIKECKFIFLSTAVALEKNMDESVKPLIRTEDMYNPHYFNGKIMAEEIISEYNNYVIVRPGSIYGVDAYGNIDVRARTLKQYIEAKNEYIRAKNICFSIVEVNELADVVIELSQNNFTGIINVSEDDPVSHYDFNVMLCEKMGWDSSFVEGNYEQENIYYFDNSLRKKILNTRINNLKNRANHLH